MKNGNLTWPYSLSGLNIAIGATDNVYMSVTFMFPP
jgi:hypothetical protein